MNKLEIQIQRDLVPAIKGHQISTINAIRSLKTAIQYEKANGEQHELTEEDVIKLIQRLIKQRQDSIEAYVSAGRQELADKEQEEKFALMKYLPPMLSEDELKTVIDGLFVELNAHEMKDMGRVMRALSERYFARYDGKVASTYIKSKLQ